MTEKGVIYMAFEADHDDYPVGEVMPVAAMLRLAPALVRQLMAVGGVISSGAMSSAKIAVPKADVVWLSLVGFRQDNSLGGVRSFFDPSNDRLVNSSTLLKPVYDMDIDDERATYADFSVPYAGEVTWTEMEFFHFFGELHVGLAAECDGRRVASICRSWRDLVAACHEAGLSSAESESRTLEIDAPAKATILAALQHYIETGQGDPSNRTDRVHELACGPGDSVISLDDAGIRELMAKVQAVSLPADRPPHVSEDEGYFENRVTVTVLSQGTPLENMDLEQIAEAITTGDCVGQVSYAAPVRLSAEAMSARLYELGSEPSFFGIGEGELAGDGESVRPMGG